MASHQSLRFTDDRTKQIRSDEFNPYVWGGAALVATGGLGYAALPAGAVATGTGTGTFANIICEGTSLATSGIKALAMEIIKSPIFRIGSTTTMGLDIINIGGCTGNVQNISKELADWLGPNSKVITNSSGDKVFVSQDGLRKIRFDMNNPNPHNSPHMHIEELVNGKWKPVDPNNAQIYPIDVPHN